MAGTHVIKTANELLSHCGIDRSIHTVSQCNSQLFIELYEALTGSQLPGLRPRPPSSETLRYEAVVNGIADLVRPHVTLEHIRGLDLARHDAVALSNLLDILCVLFHKPLSPVCGGNKNSPVCGGNRNSPVCGGDSTELDDSNVVSAEGRQIIEEVLERKLEVHSPLTPCPKTNISPLHHSTPHMPPRSRICPSSATSGDMGHTSPHCSEDIGHTSPHCSEDMGHTSPHRSEDMGHTSPHRSEDMGHTSPHCSEDMGHTSPCHSEDMDHTFPNRSENMGHSSVSPAHSSSPQAVVSLSRHIDQICVEDRNYVLTTLCKKFLQETSKPKSLNSTTKQSSRHKQHSSAQHTASVATDDLFPALKEALPSIHTSPATLRCLWQRQAAQVAALHCPPSCVTSGITKNVIEMEQRHKCLLKLLQKDLELTHRLQRQHEHRQQQTALKAAIQAKKQATARARRYYDEYELQLQAKLQKRRNREEQVFCRVFEEGLAIQRQRAAEMRRYAKERERAEAQRQHTKLQSLEKYFQDQFAMLADAVAREKKELKLREKAQSKLVDQLRREVRSRLEKEVRSLQQCLDKEEDIAHFRSLDGERLRHEWNTR